MRRSDSAALAVAAQQRVPSSSDTRIAGAAGGLSKQPSLAGLHLVGFQTTSFLSA